MLYPPPIQCPKLLKWPQVGNQSTPKKKNFILDNIFLHLSANFEIKIQNTQCYRSCLNFSTSGKSTLNSSANGPPVTYSKIQKRLSRAPYNTPTDRFLMQYISNKCTLSLRESVKKVVLDFQQPVAPP